MKKNYFLLAGIFLVAVLLLSSPVFAKTKDVNVCKNTVDSGFYEDVIPGSDEEMLIASAFGYGEKRVERITNFAPMKKYFDAESGITTYCKVLKNHPMIFLGSKEEIFNSSGSLMRVTWLNNGRRSITFQEIRGIHWWSVSYVYKNLRISVDESLVSDFDEDVRAEFFNALVDLRNNREARNSGEPSFVLIAFSDSDGFDYSLYGENSNKTYVFEDGVLKT